MSHHEHVNAAPGRAVVWLVFLGFSSIALFFLWGEHRVHLLGMLPYALLLLCPALHLFMHGGHGRHQASEARGDVGIHRGDHT